MKELTKRKILLRIEGAKKWIAKNKENLIICIGLPLIGGISTIAAIKAEKKIKKDAYDEGYEKGYDAHTDWFLRNLGYSEESIKNDKFMYRVPEKPEDRITTLGKICDNAEFNEEERKEFMETFTANWPFPDKPLTEDSIVSRIDIVKVDE